MLFNRSKPGGAIVPSLIYDDVEKAIEWLCRVFDFTERLRAVDSSGKVGHAQLAVGMGGGVLLGASRDGFHPPLPGDVSLRLTVQVEDVDAHYERAKQHGATIQGTPATYPYGERQYEAFDLAGYRWTFSQTIADVAPSEWGAQAGSIVSPLALLPRPRLCYLEIPAIDVHASAAFYEKVFGWNIRHRESGRPSFDDATTFVSGAWVTGRAPASEPGLLPYIWVDDIGAVLERAVAGGGQIVMAPQLDSPGGETIATFRDPAGNLMGLYEERRT